MATSYYQLGNFACDRGDYDGAFRLGRQALEIRKSLGDRQGMADSCYQLGNIAYHRGDRYAALEWFRDSLAISEEIGHRDGMARSLCALGAAYTEQGDAEAAIGPTLRSFKICAALGSAVIRQSIHWLARQREMLGANRFRKVLLERSDQPSVEKILNLLDQM